MNRHNLLGVVSLCWDNVDNSKWNQTFMPLNSDLLRTMFLCHKTIELIRPEKKLKLQNIILEA